jgi:hypothetical protein
MPKKHHVIHCGANLSLSDGDAASRLRRRHARRPGPNGPPAVRPRRVPLEANAFGVVRGSREVPGTRSGTGKTNPKPETRPRRSPGFFHACGSGSARGGRREGRHAPRLCCTGAVTRVATAARAEREKAAADILDCARCENGLRGKFPRAKARDVASTRFSRLFCVSETCRQSPKHENFFQTGMARSLEKGKKPSAETFAKCSTRVLRSCETFAEWASIPRRAVAVPFPRAKPEGWRRARGEPLRVPVFRRGRVSGARVCSARSRRRRFVASERPHRRGSRSRPLRDDEGARRRGHARGGG